MKDRAIVEGDPASSTSGAAPSTQLIREELERVLASSHFRAAKSQRRFLSYTVEQTLAGKASQIKELSLGLDALGRGPEFDPRIDNIVRTEASKLRARLTKYYAGEGSHDPLRIEYPRGSYVPHFSRNETRIENSGAEPGPPGITAGPLASDGPTAPPRSANDFAGLGKGWRRRAVLAAAVVGLGIAGVTGVAHFRSGPQASAATHDPSVAILPFSNLSQDRADELFADGLTEDLTDSLARIPGVRVVARRSVLPFRDNSLNLQEIGRRLGVRLVVEGSVRKVGNLLRVTAHINDAATGYQVWTESYDREWKELLAIQRQIALAITSALGLHVAEWRESGVGSSASTTAPDPDVYRDYLKGRYFWDKNTPASVRTAIGYFQRATAKDPGYAPPYVGLAHCYTALAAFSNAAVSEMVPLMRAAATKALSLDPTLGEAHVDLAEGHLYQYEWDSAQKEILEALRLKPGEAIVHRWYSYYLQKTGRLEEALAQDRQALELDPVSPYMAEGVADTLVLLRRYDEAIQEYRKVAELDPSFPQMHYGLGTAYLYRGEYQRAVAEFEQTHPLMQRSWSAGFLGYAYAKSGNPEKARELLAMMLPAQANSPAPALEIAQIHLGLGDSDAALDWLEKAVDQRVVRFNPKADPIFDSLRQTPRFQQLIRRMKLG